MFDSACRAFIRFFDNLFLSDNQIEYLRMEISKLQDRNQQLLERVYPVAVTQPVEATEETNWQPAKEFKTRDQIRREHEQASWNRAQALAIEARKEIDRKKSIEQLENELLQGVD